MALEADGFTTACAHLADIQNEAAGQMVAGMGIPGAHVKQDFVPGYA